MDVPLKIILLNLIKSCTAYCLCPGAGAELGRAGEVVKF